MVRGLLKPGLQIYTLIILVRSFDQNSHEVSLNLGSREIASTS